MNDGPKVKYRSEIPYSIIHNFSAKYVNVLVGIHQLQNYDPDNLALRSTQFTLHPDYNPVKIENDIGLIQLPQKISYTGIYWLNKCLNKVYKLELDLNLAVCGLFVIVDNFQ